MRPSYRGGFLQLLLQLLSPVVRPSRARAPALFDCPPPPRVLALSIFSTSFLCAQPSSTPPWAFFPEEIDWWIGSRLFQNRSRLLRHHVRGISEVGPQI